METNDTCLPGQAIAEEEEKEIDVATTIEILNKIPDTPAKRRYLIPTLQKVLNIYRFLPDAAIQLLMRKFNITRAEIFGVISFYPQLMITEPGKYIFRLCYGTSCFVNGANIIADRFFEEYHIRPGETDKNKIFTLQTASCLGNCGAAPMALIGDDTHGNIDPEKISELCASYRQKELL